MRRIFTNSSKPGSGNIVGKEGIIKGELAVKRVSLLQVLKNGAKKRKKKSV